MKTAIFWVITQRVVVITHRRFGKTYGFHLEGSRIPLSSVFRFTPSLQVVRLAHFTLGA
jgi:hypothetical protein